MANTTPQSICRSTSLFSTSIFSTSSRLVSRSFSAASSLQATRQVSNKEKTAREKAKKKRKKHAMYKQYDLKEMEQYSLCDAMRYIRAFEVGLSPSVPKYDCSVKLRTKKDGPIIRNQVRLPHAVKTDIRIAVICPPDSPVAKQAKEAGASLVGEDEVFAAVKGGKIDFDRCIAYTPSLPKVTQAGMPRILGPRGLMPSVKLGTVTEDVGAAVRNMLGGNMYRERQGVVRMAVGQLGFTPDQLRDNVKAFIGQLKKDAANLNEQITKEIHEVVLSSTHSPGFSLSGQFRSDDSPPVEQLS